MFYHVFSTKIIPRWVSIHKINVACPLKPTLDIKSSNCDSGPSEVLKIPWLWGWESSNVVGKIYPPRPPPGIKIGLTYVQKSGGAMIAPPTPTVQTTLRFTCVSTPIGP